MHIQYIILLWHQTSKTIQNRTEQDNYNVHVEQSRTVYSTASRTAAQSSTEQHRAEQCSTEQSRTEQCSAVQCSAVQRSAVQSSAVQSRAVQSRAVQSRAGQDRAGQRTEQSSQYKIRRELREQLNRREDIEKRTDLHEKCMLLLSSPYTVGNIEDYQMLTRSKCFE